MSSRSRPRSLMQQRAAARLASFSGHHQRMTGQWLELWNDYASSVTHNATHALSSGRFSYSSVVRDTVAFSIEATSTALVCWRDVWNSFLSPEPNTLSAADDGSLHFEIDTLSRCSSGLTLGLVSPADVATLAGTTLTSSGGANIPGTCVQFKIDGDDVYVYLADLPQLTAGEYTGSITNNGVAIADIVVLVSPPSA